MITLKEAIDNFRKQWNWMADETLIQERKVEKEEYFNAHSINEEDRLRICCYLCEFVGSRPCIKCPVKWPGEAGNCSDRDTRFDDRGLYEQWAHTIDYEKAARLAREIANLPLIEEYQEEYENDCSM